MTPLEQEIEKNHQAFLKDWTVQAEKNWVKLGGKEQLAVSYRRLSCLNAIQHTVVLPKFSSASAAFFLEAQNDALVSHVNANVGSWRTALQSLRSCIENTLCALYYSEHPVELELWSQGRFRIWFQELLKYMASHPRIAGIGGADSGLDDLKAEYETLSKAVHASATNFRMTDGASRVLLWNAEDAMLGAWSTREKKVIEAICALLICFFASDLQGARNAQLRAILSLVTRPGRRTAFRRVLKVNIA
jgi:hypothetical protein